MCRCRTTFIVILNWSVHQSAHTSEYKVQLKLLVLLISHRRLVQDFLARIVYGPRLSMLLYAMQAREYMR